MLRSREAARSRGPAVTSPERTMRIRCPSISRRALIGGASGLAGRQIFAQRQRERDDLASRTTERDEVDAGGESGSRLRESLSSTSRSARMSNYSSTVTGSRLLTESSSACTPRGGRDPAIRFDRPWEGPTSAYVTVFEDQGRYRMYYRGSPGDGRFRANLLRRKR